MRRGRAGNRCRWLARLRFRRRLWHGRRYRNHGRPLRDTRRHSHAETGKALRRLGDEKSSCFPRRVDSLPADRQRRVFDEAVVVGIAPHDVDQRAAVASGVEECAARRRECIIPDLFEVGVDLDHFVGRIALSSRRIGPHGCARIGQRRLELVAIVAFRRALHTAEARSEIGRGRRRRGRGGQRRRRRFGDDWHPGAPLKAIGRNNRSRVGEHFDRRIERHGLAEEGACGDRRDGAEDDRTAPH